MEIITNYQNRHFLYGYEIPESVLNSDFDYLSEDERNDGFMKYKGRYYHVSEFMRTESMDMENRLFPSPWQGYHSDSAFSGVLVSFSRDMETYQIATYIS